MLIHGGGRRVLVPVAQCLTDGHVSGAGKVVFVAPPCCLQHALAVDVHQGRQRRVDIFDEGVVRHAHERVVKPGVEQGLLFDRRLIIIVIGQRAQTRDLVVARGADDVAADVRLEHVAQVEHIFERAVAQREQRAQRPVDRLLRRARDVRAAALDALYDAHGLQTLDGLAHAGAADLEFGRKAQLRRQLVALLQLSAADLLEHVVHDLLVVDAGFRFHYDTSLSNIHKFCVDFLRIVFIYKEKKEWYD